MERTGEPVVGFRVQDNHPMVDIYAGGCALPAGCAGHRQFSGDHHWQDQTSL